MSAFVPSTPVVAVRSQFKNLRQQSTFYSPAISTRSFRSRRSIINIPHIVCAVDEETSSTETKDVPFEIRGFSLGNVFLALGGGVTLWSFSSYIDSTGTASVSSLGFVYGVPLLLVGCALKYAELQPVPVQSENGAKDARESNATETQKKIYSDITRHRYGDEAHLQPALASLGLIPRGEPCPILQSAIERSVKGEYEIELLFKSVATPYKVWEERRDKYDKFFGPGVSVNVKKIDSENRLVALIITSGQQGVQEQVQGQEREGAEVGS